MFPKCRLHLLNDQVCGWRGAVASDAMRWITVEHPTGGTLLGSMLLAAITFLIGGIALRSLIALRQGTFLPAS